MPRRHVILILFLVLVPLIVLSKKSSNKGQSGGSISRPHPTVGRYIQKPTRHKNFYTKPPKTRPPRTNPPRTNPPRTSRTTKPRWTTRRTTKRTRPPVTTLPTWSTLRTTKRTRPPVTTLPTWSTPRTTKRTTFQTWTTRRTTNWTRPPAVTTMPTYRTTQKIYDNDRISKKNISNSQTGNIWDSGRNNNTRTTWKPTPPPFGFISTTFRNNFTTTKQNTSNFGWITPQPTLKSTTHNYGWVSSTRRSNITFANSTTPKSTTPYLGWVTPNIINTTPHIGWVNTSQSYRNNTWTTFRPTVSNIWTKIPPRNVTNPATIPPWVSTRPTRNSTPRTTATRPSSTKWRTPHPTIRQPLLQRPLNFTKTPQYEFQPTARNNHSYWQPSHQNPLMQSPVIQQHPYPHYNYAPPPPVTIINNNINNINYPKYTYTNRDYGDSDLSFYIGYKLGQMSKPSYRYYTSTYYDGRENVAIYDHYEIHHYFHNKESINQNIRLEQNQIVSCPGDSKFLCLPNTTALCLNSGAVLCATDYGSTTPCANVPYSNCVVSRTPCVDKTCDKTSGNLDNLGLPCISRVDLQGAVINNNEISVNSNIQNVNGFCITLAAQPAGSQNSKKKWESYRTRKTYKYITRDTGTSGLGIHLGQALDDLSDPGYKYLNYQANGTYSEKYDHYYLYHHFMNGDLIPPSLDIYPNNTITCLGDSGTACPNTTLSVCLIDGSVLCLVNSSHVEPCTLSHRGCREFRISCNGSKILDCTNKTNVTILMPSISSVILHGNVSTINSSFVANNKTKSYNTLQILANDTAIHYYYLTVLIAPAEKVPEMDPIQKEAKRIHSSANSYLEVPKYEYNREPFKKMSIGYYIADKLENLNYPNYYYMNLDLDKNGSTKIYDHYDIYYAQINNNTIPKHIEIRPQNITPCQGDSATFCPPKTIALCLTSGQIMCVADILLTVPCKNTDYGKYCVEMTLSCFTMKAPKCSSPRGSRNVLLPCMSFATVYGNANYIKTKVLTSNGKTTRKISYTDLEVNDLGNNLNRTQMFCVSVAVSPAQRVPSDGAKWLEMMQGLVSKFIVAVGPK